MDRIFCSADLFHKSPFGAVDSATPVRFTLRVPTCYGCTTPYLFLQKDEGDTQRHLLEKQGNEGENELFSLTVTIGETGLYFYYFDLYVDYRKLYCGAMGEAFITTESGPLWQLTVYEQGFTTPQPLHGGVMYQIFPDRFCEGVPEKPMPYADRVYRPDKDGEPYFWPNEEHEGWLNMDYYGGDLAGIVKKLPYLSDLGVSVLYLNPVFEAHSNHRYNTANYLKIDPLLGTEQDFVALCKAAEKKGIRIILDGVFSHTGSDSVYFNRECRYPTLGAYNGPESEYRSWYDFSDVYACGYRSWWGFETLPEVNENDSAYRHFICGEGGVIDHWMRLGAAGFRLDVADELPDDFIAEIRTAVKRHGEDKYLLGEVWEDATTKHSYGSRRLYLLGKGLDATMNYPFQAAVLDFVKGGDAATAAQRIWNVCEHYPAPALHVSMNFMSTHDTVRAITAIAGESGEGKDRHWQSLRRLSHDQYEQGRRMMGLAYALIFALPGIPSIYYGDEICMQGYKDPFNRSFFQWESSEKRLRPILCQLAKKRKQCKAFADGSMHWLRAEDGVLAFERRSGKSVAALCVNRTEHNVEMRLLDKKIIVPPCDFVLVT